MHVSNTADDLRIASRRTLVRTLRQNPGVVIGELAGLTPLGTGTVSTIAHELAEAGVIHRTEVKAQGRGRPKVSIDYAPDFRYSMLFRTSAREVEGSLVDFKGALKDRLYRRRNQAESFNFCENLLSIAHEFLERQKFRPDKLGLVSITVKAAHLPLSESAERAHLTPEMVSSGLNISAEKVAIEHEQGLVAYGLLRGRQDLQRLAVLSLGNSVSLAIARRLVDGEIEVSSPNLGHSLTHPKGPACICGKRGCVESSASAFGLLRAVLGATTQTAKSAFIPDEQILAMGDIVRRGDFQARQGFALAGEALGLGLGQVFNLIGTMPVWIMGQTSPLFDLLEPSLKSALADSIGDQEAASVQLQILGDQDNRVFESNCASALDRLDRRICETGFH